MISAELFYSPKQVTFLISFFFSFLFFGKWNLLNKVLLSYNVSINYCDWLKMIDAALVFGIGSNPIIADDDRSANELMQDNNSKEEPYVSGLRRVEDGSIISNTHTVKWRLFTDNGRSLSLQVNRSTG